MGDQTEGKDAQGVEVSVAQASQTGGYPELLPVFADLQRRMVATVRGEAIQELQDVHHAIAPDGDETPPETDSDETGGEQRGQSVQQGSSTGLTLKVSRQDVEWACRTGLNAVIDTLFSDALRSIVRSQSEDTLRSFFATSRKAHPDAAAMKEARREAAQLLDDMYDSLFDEDLQNQTLQDGERVIQALLRGDVPAARREGEQALLSLSERRGAVLARHWERVFGSVVKVVAASSTAKAATDVEPGSGSETRASDESTMPQTIARSDKQAQRIWSRAYARVAREHGEGRRAERAAYDVLKDRYERRGDRWVKKSKKS